MRPFIFSEALGFSLLSLYVNPALSDPIHILTVSTPILVCQWLWNPLVRFWENWSAAAFPACFIPTTAIYEVSIFIDINRNRSTWYPDHLLVGLVVKDFAIVRKVWGSIPETMISTARQCYVVFFLSQVLKCGMGTHHQLRDST